MKAIVPDPLFENTSTPDQPDEEDTANMSAQLLGEDLDAGSDGDDKEEEEVKHDSSSLASDNIFRKLKYATGGVSALFGVGGGPIQYGHIKMEPALHVGKLIERAQNEQDMHLQPSEEKMEVELTADLEQPYELTISDYLTIAKTHLEFTDSDLDFARQLYCMIDEGAETGVQRSKLEADNTCSHHHSTDSHLQSLLNFGLVSSILYQSMWYVCMNKSELCS